MIELTQKDYLFLEKENVIKGAEKIVLRIVCMDGVTDDMRRRIMEMMADFAFYQNEVYNNYCQK